MLNINRELLKKTVGVTELAIIAVTLIAMVFSAIMGLPRFFLSIGAFILYYTNLLHITSYSHSYLVSLVPVYEPIPKTFLACLSLILIYPPAVRTISEVRYGNEMDKSDRSRIFGIFTRFIGLYILCIIMVSFPYFVNNGISLNSLYLLRDLIQNNLSSIDIIILLFSIVIIIDEYRRFIGMEDDINNPQELQWPSLYDGRYDGFIQK